MRNTFAKKSSTGNFIFAFMITLIICSCNSKSSTIPFTDSTSKTIDSVAISPSTLISDSSVVKSDWEFTDETDKMTSKKKYYGAINATELLHFKFPYNGGVIATFVVRKKDGGTDTYLKISKGQFNNTFDGGYVRVKFDSEDPKKYSFTGASDGSSDIIFISSSKNIITKLRTSKHMIIEAEFYNEGTRQIEFNTAGFVWNH